MNRLFTLKLHKENVQDKNFFSKKKLNSKIIKSGLTKK